MVTGRGGPSCGWCRHRPRAPARRGRSASPVNRGCPFDLGVHRCTQHVVCPALALSYRSDGPGVRPTAVDVEHGHQPAIWLSFQLRHELVHVFFPVCRTRAAGRSSDPCVINRYGSGGRRLTPWKMITLRGWDSSSRSIRDKCSLDWPTLQVCTLCGRRDTSSHPDRCQRELSRRPQAERWVRHDDVRQEVPLRSWVVGTAESRPSAPNPEEQATRRRRGRKEPAVGTEVR